MEKGIYRRLQEQLDQYSLGFPSTDSGIEIKILERLFSEEDAHMFLSLTPKLETPEEIARRVNMSPDDVAASLSDMAERGLLFSLKKDDTIKYGAIPFVHGLYEFQIKRIDREMADLVKKYSEDEFENSIVNSASSFLRTIPVQHSIAVEHNIAPYEDASEILRKATKIVVTECICRTSSNLIDRGCQKPSEVCFMFGSMGQYYLDHEMGREVETDEALKILTEAQEAGLVTQPASSQNPGGMCCCCGDCCGVLAALNNYPKPSEMVFSNYFSEIDKDLCSGCEICEESCQMEAIMMDERNLASINLDRCIGCGLCVVACPDEALKLTSKPAHQRRTPPATAKEQMLIMAQNRGLI